jgi:predicted permease
VTAQIALSVLLSSAALLFVGHLSNLRNLGLGFRHDHVLLVVLDPARGGYERGQLAGLYQELLARLEAIPGVRSATIAGATPIQGAGASRFVTAEGYRERPEDRRYMALNWIAPKYFETLGTPLLAGRDFQFDDQNRPRVAIINQALARYYFAGRNPIGKHITPDGDDKPFEIVGVVGDARYTELHDAPPRTMYLNAFQAGWLPSQFALRTSVEPASAIVAVRQAVRDVLKTVPLEKVTTLTDQVDAAIVPERLIATLSGFFGALGAALAGIGLYGLLAYTVARRINEIGIRMALGATAGDVTHIVLRDALAMAGTGLILGVPLAIWGRSVAAALVQDLTVHSATPLALSAVGIIAVALLASYVPALRAARVSPMEALRHE